MNGPKICHKIDEFIDFELRQIDMSGIPIEIDELFGWSFKKKGHHNVCYKMYERLEFIDNFGIFLCFAETFEFANIIRLFKVVFPHLCAININD